MNLSSKTSIEKSVLAESCLNVLIASSDGNVIFQSGGNLNDGKQHDLF